MCFEIWTYNWAATGKYVVYLPENGSENSSSTRPMVILGVTANGALQGTIIASGMWEIAKFWQ